jgi:hypothetical protein
MAPYSVGPVYRVLPVSSGGAALTEPLAGFHPPPRRTERADFRSPAQFARSSMRRSQLEMLSILIVSPASTTHDPIASVFLFLYIFCLSSWRLPSVSIRRPCPPYCQRNYETARFFRSPGRYPSSSLLQTLPPRSIGRTCSGAVLSGTRKVSPVA